MYQLTILSAAACGCFQIGRTRFFKQKKPTPRLWVWDSLSLFVFVVQAFFWGGVKVGSGNRCRPRRPLVKMSADSLKIFKLEFSVENTHLRRERERRRAPQASGSTAYRLHWVAVEFGRQKKTITKKQPPTEPLRVT